MKLIQMNIKAQIEELERKLFLAMKEIDLDTLEELLHHDLIFNLPTGVSINKEADLETYRSGKMIVKNIVPADQVINIIEDVAVVAVTIKLEADFDEHSINGDYRYLRIWKKVDDGWKIIGGSCCMI